MKPALLIILITFIASHADCQVKIDGRIKDNRGRGVPGASVTIRDSYDGATSDSTGYFHFATTESGAHFLTITAVGYRPLEEKITIKDAVTLQFSMKEQLDELKAVMVTAGSFEAGDRKRAATVLSSLDVVTTGGANADITSAVKTLPGAQQVGEQEGLFVRGGTGAETKQFIDGTLVNNPYFTSIPDISSRGRFSPFLFKGTVFSTGGYSALYGQALSSALILESIDLPERSEVDASISPILIGAGTQRLAENKKFSYGINYSYVNLIAYFNLVKQTPDYFSMPQFHNFDANFRIKTKHGIIKYYTTYGEGKIGLRRPDIDSLDLKDAFGLKNNNFYNNLSWREDIGRGWRMNLGLGYSTNKDNIEQQLQDQGNVHQTSFPDQPWLKYKNFSLLSRQDLTQGRAVFEKKLSGISAVRFGAENWYAYNNNKYNGTDSTLTDNYQAVFGESDIYITNELALKVGGRFEHSSIIDKVNIAPRLSLAYRTGVGAQVSFAYGIFYQKPETLQLLATTRLGYTKATHYILNYQKILTDRIFRVEAFYKKYDDLIKTVPYNYFSGTYNNSGTGYAQGVELFFRDKHTIRNLDYWVSYSYLDTKRNYLNYPGEIAPTFAAKHTASLVVKRFVTKIKTGFNFTYSYATGRPYYRFVYNDAGKTFSIGDQGMTKPYNSLGFSMNYVPSVGKTNAKLFWVLVASVTNVLRSDQVYGYNYSYNGAYREPVNPPAKSFYFIGAFFSWGVDRTQDAINNNL
ncbi:MAG: TonB-dependent receptor [Chitinophagaceae bacterium]|nr:TonB-dependent receptor [Chitinophagaceae bacterium]